MPQYRTTNERTAVFFLYRIFALPMKIVYTINISPHWLHSASLCVYVACRTRLFLPFFAHFRCESVCVCRVENESRLEHMDSTETECTICLRVYLLYGRHTNRGVCPAACVCVSAKKWRNWSGKFMTCAPTIATTTTRSATMFHSMCAVIS